eukprot:m.245134 g.245134  ORF g.245134 m.245134 type:complete len:55 (-) comp26393_c1_seq1:1690-1854(-)
MHEWRQIQKSDGSTITAFFTRLSAGGSPPLKKRGGCYRVKCELLGQFDALQKVL